MPRAIGKGYTILGLTACLACGREMPAKKSAGGKLSLCCTWCDFAAYINPGTKAHELLLDKVKLEAPAKAAGGEPEVKVTSSSLSPPPAAPAGASSSPPAEEVKAPERKFTGPLFGS